MVASSFQGRPTIVDRAKVGQIVCDGVKTGIRSLGMLAVNILETGGDSPFVKLPGTCASLLYSMRSPDFEPRFCEPLHFMAIGSGSGVVEGMKRVHAQMLFDDPSDEGQQSFWFRNQISFFIESNRIDSVGGLYPAIKVRGNQFGFIPQKTIYYREATSRIEADVKLEIENGHWIQKNDLSGKAIGLEPPWSLLEDPKASLMFDDIDSRRWRK